MIAAVVSLDTYVEQLIAAHRTPFLDTVFVWLTQLGDARWITVVALAIAFLAWRHKRYEYKAGLAVALFGALLASFVLKLAVHRIRPGAPFALLEVTGYSFPSMHAAVSLATYGFLAYMTWKLMHPPHHRAPWMFFLCALVALIGFSRVYLGVHYLSDVLGGYVIGGVFLALGVLVTERLGAHGRLRKRFGG
jgi:undecaprenyl-diphosphatase